MIENHLGHSISYQQTREREREKDETQQSLTFLFRFNLWHPHVFKLSPVEVLHEVPLPTDD